ncbi:hypothetical protein KP78_30270 [Jeotgalibacillus soli]|uniref:Uncharacterized protein n=1 Tax=Jeotgalibacillus soli TaxID=889306 RepID=A0A0C2VNA3_9BACL|nr:hypothetical protein KP78_30270 [Jeotgalibacillus soli]
MKAMLFPGSRQTSNDQIISWTMLFIEDDHYNKLPLPFLFSGMSQRRIDLND